MSSQEDSNNKITESIKSEIPLIPENQIKLEVGEDSLTPEGQPEKRQRKQKLQQRHCF